MGVYTAANACVDEERKVGEVGHEFEGDRLERIMINGDQLSPLGLLPQGEVRKASKKRLGLPLWNGLIKAHELQWKVHETAPFSSPVHHLECDYVTRIGCIGVGN